jgi:hypothetical protein
MKEIRGILFIFVLLVIGFFVGLWIGFTDNTQFDEGRAFAAEGLELREAEIIADAYGRGREEGIKEMQQQALARGVGEMILDENERPQWRWRKLVIRTVTPRPTPVPEVLDE